MRGKKLSLGLTVVLAGIALAGLTAAVSAQTEKALHSFNNNGKDGLNPTGGVTFDADGNLYGTTTGGGAGVNCGAAGCGTVFKLTPIAGGWAEKVVHNFTNNGKDGYGPVTGVIFDASGNIFGTTYTGGEYGYGTVFELVRTPAGGLAEKILHSFNFNGTDGATPRGDLVMDRAGNLYGTTFGGGAYQGGAAFELAPASGGAWTETVVHSFGNDSDGAAPWAGMIFDGDGNLYGTAVAGGAHGGGVVFELTPGGAGGAWTEKILHSFGAYARDGLQPKGRVIFDAAGNLYGTTSTGGTVRGEPCPSCGTVFELVRAGDGTWAEKVLHIFGLTPSDGYLPTAGLVFDGSGNLYSTTSSGGHGGNGGTVFELMPTAGGWAEKMLHSFSHFTSTPFPNLIFDGAGNLYGTTAVGGAHNGGTVFEIMP